MLPSGSLPACLTPIGSHPGIAGSGSVVPPFFSAPEWRARRMAGQAEGGGPGTIREGKDRPAARILIVDDNPELLSLASAILAGQGHAVVAVGSGDAATLLLEQGERFDLLISDVVMPGRRDGYDLAAQAAALHPALPVLLMSGFVPDTERPVPAAAGFLQKPFHRSELIDAIRTALRAGDH